MKCRGLPARIRGDSSAYGVQAVAKHFEKSHPTAHYMPGSLQAGRAGTFFANTYGLDKRPKRKWRGSRFTRPCRAITLQMALARELEGIPDVRRHGEYTAFARVGGCAPKAWAASSGSTKTLT
jgi:uncharacterized protein (DUF885 family)